MELPLLTTACSYCAEYFGLSMIISSKVSPSVTGWGVFSSYSKKFDFKRNWLQVKPNLDLTSFIFGLTAYISIIIAVWGSHTRPPRDKSFKIIFNYLIRTFHWSFRRVNIYALCWATLHSSCDFDAAVIKSVEKIFL